MIKKMAILQEMATSANATTIISSPTIAVDHLSNKTFLFINKVQNHRSLHLKMPISTKFTSFIRNKITTIHNNKFNNQMSELTFETLPIIKSCPPKIMPHKTNSRQSGLTAIL